MNNHSSDLFSSQSALRTVDPLARFPRATLVTLSSGASLYRVNSGYPVPFLARNTTLKLAAGVGLGASCVLAFESPAFAPSVDRALCNVGLMTLGSSAAWFGLGHFLLFRRRLRIDVSNKHLIRYRWPLWPQRFSLPLIERFTHHVHRKVEIGGDKVAPVYRDTFHVRLSYDGQTHPFITIVGKQRAVAVCERLNGLVKKKIHERDRRESGGSGVTRDHPDRIPGFRRPAFDSEPDL